VGGAGLPLHFFFPFPSPFCPGSSADGLASVEYIYFTTLLGFFFFSSPPSPPFHGPKIERPWNSPPPFLFFSSPPPLTSRKIPTQETLGKNLNLSLPSLRIPVGSCHGVFPFPFPSLSRSWRTRRESHRASVFSFLFLHTQRLSCHRQRWWNLPSRAPFLRLPSFFSKAARSSCRICGDFFFFFSWSASFLPSSLRRGAGTKEGTHASSFSLLTDPVRYDRG